MLASSPRPGRTISIDDIPAFFCRPDAPGVPFVQPWMDMRTGDCFEHTERAAHPHAMQNKQLQDAYGAFVAAKGLSLSTRDALATLRAHTRCPITCDGMRQPVRAPDNILYEAESLVQSLHTWKPISPMTRAPFPDRFTLTVDKRMQQLSAACGTLISDADLHFTQRDMTMPRFATSEEAAEAGVETLPRAERLRVAAHVGLSFCEGAVAAAVLRAVGMAEMASALGGFAFFVGASILPSVAWARRARQPARP